MSTTDVISARWRTSSYTTGNGACVEIAELPHMTAVRDSKDRGGPVLIFTPTAFANLVSAIKEGRLAG